MNRKIFRKDGPLFILILLMFSLSVSSEAARDKFSKTDDFSLKKIIKSINIETIGALGISGTYSDVLKKASDYTLDLTPVIEAVVFRDNSDLKDLIAEGAPLNDFYTVYPRYEDSEVHDAESPHFLFTPLMSAALFNNREAMEILLASGADVNRRHDKYHHTALECSVMGNHPNENAAILIKAGADKESLSQALIIASARSNVELCRMLLDAGADSNARNSAFFSNRQTALLAAADNRNKDIAELLLAHGANVNIRMDRSPEYFRELVSLKYVVKRYDILKGLTVRSNDVIACSNTWTGVIMTSKALIEYYSEKDMKPSPVSLTERDELDALQIVMNGGFRSYENKTEARGKNMIDMAALLINYKAAVNPSNGSRSALMHALWFGHYDAAEFLLSKGALPHYTDRLNLSACDYFLNNVNDRCGMIAYSPEKYNFTRMANAMIDSYKTSSDRAKFKVLLLSTIDRYRGPARPNYIRSNAHFTSALDRIRAGIEGKK